MENLWLLPECSVHDLSFLCLIQVLPLLSESIALFLPCPGTARGPCSSAGVYPRVRVRVRVSGRRNQCSIVAPARSEQGNGPMSLHQPRCGGETKHGHSTYTVDGISRFGWPYAPEVAPGLDLVMPSGVHTRFKIQSSNSGDGVHLCLGARCWNQRDGSSCCWISEFDSCISAHWPCSFVWCLRGVGYRVYCAIDTLFPGRRRGQRCGSSEHRVHHFIHVASFLAFLS